MSRAQWSRSGVYFGIIPPEQEPEEGQDGPDPKEIPLRNSSIPISNLSGKPTLGWNEGADRQAQNLKVATDAHKLKNDLNRLYDENKEKLGGPLGEMLQQATSSVENLRSCCQGELDGHFSVKLLRTRGMSAMLRAPSKSNKPQKLKWTR